MRAKPRNRRDTKRNVSRLFEMRCGGFGCRTSGNFNARSFREFVTKAKRLGWSASGEETMPNWLCPCCSKKL